MWPKILIIVFIFLADLSVAQDFHHHCKKVPARGKEFVLDSLTVLPGSIHIKSDGDTISHFSFNVNTGVMVVREDLDTIEVCYATLPYRLTTEYMKRNLAEYNEQQYYRAAGDLTKSEDIAAEREELFPTDNISKSGSLSRGISFGNTQNVVVNSTLNLQMEGKLSDDLNIRASITDQNVPFQPEGNTAQIQDFDNIFMEIYNNNFSLKGGDILLQNKPSAFLKYYKNVQGGLLSTKYQLLSGKSQAETSIGISVAKGKFASVVLEVQEGVSGPYRVKVQNAGDYIIILANSEKVYLDGKQLQRGYDYDYIIDYNKAEIQFTSQVLITKFSRVRIDFEYSDRNYSRSAIAANHYQKIGRANLFFNYYSEKDNPNRPLTFNLDQSDKELMQSIGDNLDQAVRVSAEKTQYNQGLILYEKIDTIDATGQSIQIFKYSTNETAELYTVGFNEAGTNQGNYQLVNSTLNGRVYQWVSPIDGIKRGNYEPISRIPAPNRKDMITLGGGYQITRYDDFSLEAAFSKNDLNLFSSLDSNDDNGKALKIGYHSAPRPIGLGLYKFSGGVNYEFDDQYFTPIDRYRYVEFDRDWNYDPSENEDKTDDHIFNMTIRFEKDRKNQLSYEMTQRKRGVYVNGAQHKIGLAKEFWRFQVDADIFTMKSQGFNSTTIQKSQNAQWQRIKTDVHYNSRIFVPGYTYTVDRNAIYAPYSDSVISTAMNYAEHQFYIRNNDTLHINFGASYSLREDRAPQSGELAKSNTSKTIQAFMKSSINPDHNINFFLTYRNNINYQLASGPKDEETVMTRLDWISNFFERHIRSDLSYAVGNGRELKREYVFVQTATGEGTHTWRDDNGDGVQDLSEFYLAVNPDERNYIKIFVPTDEYVSAYENNFNYRLNLDMPHQWRESVGIRKFLSRFSNISSWSIIRRTTDPDLASRFLPFYNHIPEEDLLSLRESIRSRLFFNRANAGFAWDIGYLKTGNKQLLSNGFEDRRLEDYSANVRWNINRFYNFKIYMASGTTTSNSDYLQGRNYSIEYHKIGPEIAWQPGNQFRLSSQLSYTNKYNILSETGGETAELQEANVSAKMNKTASYSLNAIFRLINIKFDGKENTAVGYEMLEALRPGTNIAWSFSFQKKILNGLQIALDYEGRKSEGSSVVHIGRMQVSALF